MRPSMFLKLVLSTKRSLAFATFEFVGGDMCGPDVSPEDCLTGEDTGVSATLPTAFQLTGAIRVRYCRA
jgi:hypothetical protein